MGGAFLNTFMSDRFFSHTDVLNKLYPRIRQSLQNPMCFSREEGDPYILQLEFNRFARFFVLEMVDKKPITYHDC